MFGHECVFSKNLILSSQSKLHMYFQNCDCLWFSTPGPEHNFADVLTRLFANGHSTLPNFLIYLVCSFSYSSKQHFSSPSSPPAVLPSHSTALCKRQPDSNSPLTPLNPITLPASVPMLCGPGLQPKSVRFYFLQDIHPAVFPSHPSLSPGSYSSAYKHVLVFAFFKEKLCLILQPSFSCFPLQYC